MPAGSSVTIIANKTITGNDVNTFNNTAKLVSASADNADLTGNEIKASKSVNIQSLIKIANTSENIALERHNHIWGNLLSKNAKLKLGRP